MDTKEHITFKSSKSISKCFKIKHDLIGYKYTIVHTLDSYLRCITKLRIPANTYVCTGWECEKDMFRTEKAEVLNNLCEDRKSVYLSIVNTKETESPHHSGFKYSKKQFVFPDNTNGESIKDITSSSPGIYFFQNLKQAIIYGFSPELNSLKYEKEFQILFDEEDKKKYKLKK